MRRISVILLDPRGIIGEGNQDIFYRHQEYASELERQAIHNGYTTKFLILTTNRKPQSKNITEDSNFKAVSLSRPNRFSIYFTYKCYRYLRQNNIQPKVLISGDPWESLIQCTLLKFLLHSKNECKVQTQIHADIFSPSWNRANVINFTRYLMVRLLLRQANQIRTVSKDIANKLQYKFSISESKIIIAPVPLNLDFKGLRTYPNNRSKSIGFMGRIQDDRGLDNFIQLIRKLSSEDDEIKYIVVGDGPRREWLESTITEMIPKKVFISTVI
jgi:glycosyltransferase involved in cell wall biosynthesis